MNRNRFVQLYTWYVSPGGKRQFIVVDKSGKSVSEQRAGGMTSVYQTTLVKLSEVLNPNPVTYDIDKFWELVDAGKLIEFIPGVTVIETVSSNTEPAVNRLPSPTHIMDEQWA